MTPGSCSTGIHIILEELEEIFEAHIVNLPAGDQFKPAYTAINPKSNIPALARPDGRVGRRCARARRGRGSCLGQARQCGEREHEKGNGTRCFHWAPPSRRRAFTVHSESGKPASNLLTSAATSSGLFAICIISAAR